MRAVGFKEFGDPEVLEVMDIPEVSAGPGEIRIKNYASAVNPTDIVSRSGLISQFRKDFPLPSVPGMDISGTVDQVGEGVETGINIGDRVFTSGDGNVFPSGILIGNIFIDSKKKLRVNPIANFESLEFLRILNARKIVADWKESDLVGMENF